MLRQTQPLRAMSAAYLPLPLTAGFASIPLPPLHCVIFVRSEHTPMKANRHSLARPLPSQQGVVLVVALVFLVILTLLGIGVFSTTTSEEAMVRNFRDREIALQAAEAALNEAKVLITGSYDTDGAWGGFTPPKPLSEENCYVNTPTGYTCDQGINVVTLDLFSGSINGALLGHLDLTGQPSISPPIPGFYGGDQPRYLVIWQKPVVCGKSNTGYCFLIVAQSRGRLSNTRVNLAELYTR